ncbi:MAG: hypothetical protein GWN12_16490, partial [Thermoplasmata archaeon]|nr:hypothetical protein [Thermoplasmata archaeon]NIW90331.1 hypothetical protein [Thermoplasmata archaeon]
MGMFLPSAPAHVDPDSPLAVYCITDLDQVYTIGSDVTVNVLVYWEGAYHDPVDVAPQVDGRPLTEVRRAEGRYEVTF